MSVEVTEVRLVRRPVGLPAVDDFEVVKSELESPAEGQVLVRNAYVALDPYLRLSMSEEHAIHGLLPLERVVPGLAVGEVIESAHPGYPVGTWVTGPLGWRDHVLTRGRGLRVVDPLPSRASHVLGPLGMPGFTAWCGIELVTTAGPDDVVYVSAAAGAVGSVAGQLAHLNGARVIGSASTPERVDWLRAHGFDEVFDHRRTAVAEGLREAAPDGLTIYFDNVAGEPLEAALDALRDFGTVVCCGALSIYNNPDAHGPANLHLLSLKALSMLGFRYLDYQVEHFDRFASKMSELLAGGEVVTAEHIVPGIENAPGAFVDSFTKAAIGKTLIAI